MLVLLAALALGVQPAPAKKVLVIGIDGCRSDALGQADTPYIDSLVRNGSYAVGRADPLAMSGPGWTTVLTGAWSNKHRVSSNDFAGANTKEYPDFLTTIERLKPALRTVVAAEWAAIGDKLVQHADYKGHRVGIGDEAVALEAATQLTDFDPDVLFVHFGAVDTAGHAHGFDPKSPEYLRAIEETDKNIGLLLTAVQSRRRILDEDWLVIVTSDHGGHGTAHGENRPSDINVPFIVSGRSADHFVIVPTSVDVAPTVFAHLGIAPGNELDWDGVPVGLKGVFTGMLAAFRDARLVKFVPEDGFLLGDERLTIVNDEEHTTIRYTLDGTLPTLASPSGSSVVIERSSLVRARSFGPVGTLGPSNSLYVTVQDAPLVAVSKQDVSPGLSFRIVRGKFDSTAPVDFSKPDRRGVIAAPTASLGESADFAAQFTGYIRIEKAGVYRFGVVGTGESALKIGARTIANLVALESGLHLFELTTVQPKGSKTLAVTVSERFGKPEQAKDSLFAH